MLAALRAGLLAVPLLLAAISTTFAADKPFQRYDFADSAVRLEAQIKTEAGTSPSRSRRCAARPTRRLRAAISAPACSCWRRSSRRAQDSAQLAASLARHPANPPATTTASAPPCSNAPRPPPTSPISARGNPRRGSRRLVLLGRTLRGAQAVAAGARCAAALARPARGRRRARAATSSCATSTASACSTTRSMPTPPRRAPASSSPKTLPGKRTDFSPFVARRRATTSRRSRREDKQLCVEGLKHGERYSITLRAGLPSTVQENAARSRPITTSMCATAARSCASPARPMCCRAPASAAFRSSASIRGGEGQDLSHRRPQPDRHRARRATSSATSTATTADGSRTRAAQLAWKGELKIESVLNADVTTAFPVDQAIGDLKPGVYVMTAEPDRRADDEDYGQLATQWFIVSDLGLTAFSGNDGINVFVNSLASTEAKARNRNPADRAQQRSAGDAHDRRQRLCALRGRPGARGGRSRARDAGRATARATTRSSA